MPRSALMNVMVQAAMKAGRGLARDFGEVEKLQVSVKGPGDFVSAADHRAEKTIYEELSKARPGYSFLMEESGAIEGTDTSHRWIVDPLDGTTNFLHGIPHFCISIGLEREGTLVAGVVYNPVRDELFTAERGAGAFMNDKRIRVAGRRQLTDAVVAISIPNIGRQNRTDGHFREMVALIPRVAGFRQTGASALDLAWVASGRLDAFWDDSLDAWDIAAGLLLVREAGGFATDVHGGEKPFETRSILAANESLHRALVPLLTAARKAN